MASVGGAIADGLTQGLRLGADMAERKRRQQLDEERRRQVEEDRGIAAEDRKRRIEREDRTVALDEDTRALTAIDSEVTALKGEFEALQQQYGAFEKIPEETRTALDRRRRDTLRRRREINERRLRPVIEREQTAAKELLTGLASGKVDVQSVPPEVLYRAFGVAARRKPEEFMRDESGASKIGTAVQGLMAQFENPGSEEDMLAAINIILEPELRQGVGGPGKDGSEIIKKEVVKLIPAKGREGEVLPVLKVTVRRADGAIGEYMAPVTAGRSSDADDDEVTSIGIDKALDYAGNMGMLEELLNTPGFRERVLEGAPKGSVTLDEFLAGAAELGVKPHKPKVTSSNVDLGDKVTRITTDDSGAEVRRENMPKGIDPTRQAVAREATTRAGIRGSAGSAIDRRLAHVDQLVEDGVIDPADAPIIKRQIVAGGGRGAATRDQPLSDTDADKRIERAEKLKAKELGLVWNADRKAWVNISDGKKANETQLKQINEAGLKAARETEKLIKGGQPDATLPAAAKAKLKEGANTRFKNGQVWTLKNGKPERVE